MKNIVDSKIAKISFISFPETLPETDRTQAANELVLSWPAWPADATDILILQLPSEAANLLREDWPQWPLLDALEDFYYSKLEDGPSLRLNSMHLSRVGWQHLEKQKLFCCDLDPDDIRSIIKNTILFANLQRLNLFGAKIGSSGVTVLSRVAAPKIIELELTYTELESGSGTALAQLLSAWPSLEILVLEVNDLVNEDIEILLQVKMEKLEKIDLSSNKLSLNFGKCLAERATQWPSLRHGQITDNDLYVQDMTYLSNAPFIDLRIDVNLSYFSRSDPGVQIDRSYAWPTLKTLKVYTHEDSSRRMLSKFPSWKWDGLEDLRIEDCYYGRSAAGIVSAFGAGQFPKLQRLSFEYAGAMDGYAIWSLFKLPLLKLESLILSKFDLQIALWLVVLSVCLLCRCWNFTWAIHLFQEAIHLPINQSCLPMFQLLYWENGDV